MRLSFSDLQRRAQPLVMVVHSLDMALYQVTGKIDGQEYLLSENDGKVFRRRALTQVREALRLLPLAKLSLRQSSAYDEMIGQPVREGDNTLEVPLSLEAYSPPTVN
jgi:hypothetical protein